MHAYMLMTNPPLITRSTMISIWRVNAASFCWKHANGDAVLQLMVHANNYHLLSTSVGILYFHQNQLYLFVLYAEQMVIQLICCSKLLLTAFEPILALVDTGVADGFIDISVLQLAPVNLRLTMANQVQTARNHNVAIFW